MRQLELDAIKAQADLHGVDHRFMKAIRVAENGLDDVFKGAPYGVLPDPHDVAKSLQVACASVRNLLIAAQDGHVILVPTLGLQGYISATYSEAALDAIAKHWAPVGAPNDPNNKNANWKANVRGWYGRIVKEGDAALLESSSTASS